MLIECNQGAGFGFTAAERVLFDRIFEEKLGAAIPTLLLDISKDIKVISLPGCGTEEFADYLNLEEDTAGIIKTVTTLGEQAVNSYVWNVRNAYIKGGRLRLYSGQKLHITDWKNEFCFKIVKNMESGCPGDIIKGWAAYHYRFAATKI